MEITQLQKHLIRTMARKYDWITAGRDPADELLTMENPHGYDLTKELEYMDQWMNSLTRNARGDRGWTRKDWYHRLQNWLRRKKRTPGGHEMKRNIEYTKPSKAQEHEKRLYWDNPIPIDDPECASILDNIYRGLDAFHICRADQNARATGRMYIQTISLKMSTYGCAAEYLQELLHIRIQHYHPASPRLLRYLASHGEGWLLHLFLEAFHEQTILSEKLPLSPRLTRPDHDEPCNCPGHDPSGSDPWCEGPGWWIRREKPTDGFIRPARKPTRREEIMVAIDLSNPRSLSDLREAIRIV